MAKRGASKQVSRREFVKGAAGVAGVAAVGALASCVPLPAATPTAVPTAAPKPWLPAKWDYEADVVVVGFGGAGGSAAIEAHDAGAKVIILEKTPTPGGSTTLCAGIYYGAGTSLQKAEGITDTADEMYKYLAAIGRVGKGGRSDPERIRVWADKSAETFEWIKGLGATFYTGVNYIEQIPQIKPLAEDAGWALYYSGAEPDPEFAAITPPKVRGHVVRPVAPTYPYPPKHPTAPTAVGITRGTGWFKPLWEGAKARGIQVLLETRAMALVTDPLTNEVLGVKADSKGTTLYIKARRAVHLAAGGFSQNKEMTKIWCPEAQGGVNFTASDTGDGIQMGMAIGASAVNMDRVLAPGPVRPSGSILVNYGGRRFDDETLHYGSKGLWTGQRNSIAFAILDEDIRKAAGVATTIQASTIGELARQIRIDPAVLEDTVNFYNESVALVKDREFGRRERDSQKHPPDEVVVPAARAMMPIKTPPFHAMRSDHNNFTGTITIGGLRINTKAQVIDVYGKVIPRLYAAGSTTGGMLDIYVGSGHAVSQALNFGRIAGKNAAAEMPWA